MGREILRGAAITVGAAVVGWLLAVGLFFGAGWYLDAHDEVF